MVGFIRQYALFIVSVLVIVVGYVMLAGGDITLAPILLIVGYCVLTPLFLIRSFLKKKGE
jgi:hypothetical protein